MKYNNVNPGFLLKVQRDVVFKTKRVSPGLLSKVSVNNHVDVVEKKEINIQDCFFFSLI
jgi:hypothetical protein